jgi:hypothetical protein
MAGVFAAALTSLPARTPPSEVGAPWGSSVFLGPLSGAPGSGFFCITSRDVPEGTSGVEARMEYKHALALPEVQCSSCAIIGPNYPGQDTSKHLGSSGEGIMW